MKREHGFKFNKIVVLLLVLAQITSLTPGIARAATPAVPASQVNYVQNEESSLPAETFTPARGDYSVNTAPIITLPEDSIPRSDSFQEPSELTYSVPESMIQKPVVQTKPVTEAQLIAIEKWLAYDVIHGMPDGKFYPERLITRAEVATILLSVFGYLETGSNQLSDISSNAWYSEAVNKIVKASIFEGDSFGNFRPDAAITKQEMLLVLARAFDIEPNLNADFTAFTDSEEIPLWSKAYIGGLLSAGYDLKAMDRSLRVTDPITRAEFVEFINNMTQVLYNLPGEYTGDILGNLVINTAGVQLHNAKITGDLFLTQGIGSGDVVLEDVIVEGRTIIRGGGSHSIIIRNTSINKMYVIKQDGQIRVVAEGSTEISAVSMGSGATLVEQELNGGGFGDVEIMEIPAGQIVTLTGSFAELSLAAPEVSVEITETSVVGNMIIKPEASNSTVSLSGTASITTLTNDAVGMTLQVGSEATITSLTANTASNITGSGTIASATFNAVGSTMETQPTVVVLKEGITVEVAGETLEESILEVIPPLLPPPPPPVEEEEEEYIDYLAIAKATAFGELNIALSGYTESQYSAENWLSIVGYKAAGDVAIGVAYDIAGVIVAKNQAVLNMAAVQKIEIVVEPTDLTAYYAALAAVNEADYTVESWAAYQVVVAQNVMTAENTPAEVIEATQNIIAAQAYLVLKEIIVEPTDLTAYYAALASVNEADYTVESWAAYQVVVAQNVMTTENMPAEVIEATQNIVTAQANLIVKEIVLEPTDLTAYNAALVAVAESDYTVESWSAYQLIISSNVVTAENTTTEVATATQNITTAQGNLVYAGLSALTGAKAFAASKVQSDYTIVSWTAFSEALTLANSLPESTNVEIVAKTTAITNAIALLVLKADLTAYNAALSAVTEADYTTESWSAYQLIVLANVVTTENTTIEVAAATQNITTAQDSLVYAGLSALTGAKALAVSKVQSEYTIVSWTAFNEALTIANTLAESTNAEIVVKTTTITNAIALLVLKADLTAYNAALAAVVESDYTVESWSAYQLIVLANVVTTENTTIEVAAATQNITTAQGSLVYAGLAALTGAKALAADKVQSEHTIISWTAFSEALTIANTLAESTNAEIVVKTTAITNAIALLVLKADLTAYNAALDSVNEADYTVESWSAYQLIVSSNVVTTENTITEVLNATQNITVAQGNLVYAGLSALTGAKAFAASKVQSEYTIISWTAFSEALAVANALPESTNAEIVAKTTAITTAITLLVLKADLTAYNAALVAVVESDYTVESWSAYQLIVLANVVTNENTTTEVAVATQNITTAQGNLVYAGLSALTAAKNSAASKVQSEYTIISWTAFSGAQTTANALPETTNAEIVAKTTAITNAIALLVLKADLTSYNAALAAVIETNYTTESWSAYQLIVSANLVTAENTTTEVATATQNITVAQGNLVYAGLSALTAAKESAAAKVQSEYTIVSWTAFSEALTTAMALHESTNAEIVAKTSAITNAIALLILKADLTAYNAALSAVTESDYTTESWLAYQLIISSNVVTAENTTTEVITATQNITTAQGNLIYTGLSALTTAKESAAGKVQSEYTIVSWSSFSGALTTANSLPESTNAEIVAKTTAITNAIALLVLKADLTAYNATLVAVTETDYTTESWLAYQLIVLANVVTAENTTTEVITATQNITTAQGNLIYAGLSALTTAKESAAGKVQSEYTIVSWTAFSEALTTANALPETTNAEIVVKTTAITNAIALLVLKADLTAYNAALSAVTETDYTTASWLVYQAVVTANIVTPENSVSEVAVATNNILAAQTALTLNSAKEIAFNELSIVLLTYSQAEYSSEDWVLLLSYKTSAETAINTATDLNTISSAKNNAIALMDAVNILPKFSDTETNSIQIIAEKQGLLPLIATDADSDSLTFSLISGALPNGITLNNDGTFSGTALVPSAGEFLLTLRVTDSKGGYRQIELTITVKKLYTKTINIIDSDLSTGPLKDIQVTIGQQTQITDASGNTLFELIAEDTLINLTGYGYLFSTYLVTADQIASESDISLTMVRNHYIFTIYSRTTDWVQLKDIMITSGTQVGITDGVNPVMLRLLPGISTITVERVGYFSQSFTVEKYDTNYDPYIDYIVIELVLDPAQSDALFAYDKQAAKQDLANVFATYIETTYAPENWLLVLDAKNRGDSEIESALDLVTVLSAKTRAIKRMDAVLSYLENRIAAFADLNLALLTLSQTNYTPENWSLLNQIKTDGDTALNAATTYEQVCQIQTDVLVSLKAVASLDVALMALQLSKIDAKLDLYQSFRTYDPTDYSDNHWPELGRIKDTGILNIENSVDQTAIDLSLSTAVVGMANVIVGPFVYLDVYDAINEDYIYDYEVKIGSSTYVLTETNYDAFQYGVGLYLPLDVLEDYPMTISKSGYAPLTTTIWSEDWSTSNGGYYYYGDYYVLAGETVLSIDITVTQPYLTTPLSGITVKLVRRADYKEWLVATDTNGIAHFPVNALATYYYHILFENREDYRSYYSNYITLTNTNVAQTVVLTPNTSSAKFTVYDDTRMRDPWHAQELAGATVTLTHQTLQFSTSGQTNSYGEIQIDGLPFGTYNYVIQKDEYEDFTGTITTPNWGYYGAEIVNVTANLNDLYSDVKVVTGWTGYPAYVTIGEQTIHTTAQPYEQAANFKLLNGNHAYRVVYDPEVYEEFEGVITVNDADQRIEFTPVHKTRTYTVVVTGMNQYLEGAAVTLNNQTILTDENGEAAFTISSGNFTGSVSKYNFYNAGIGLFTIDHNNDDFSPITQSINLQPVDCTVYLNSVTNGVSNLTSYSMTVDGTPVTLVNLSNGKPGYHPYPGSHTYVISRQGYLDATGSFNVEQNSPTVGLDVIMTEATKTVTFDLSQMSDWDSKVEGATVTIQNQTITTNYNGQASLALMNGTYEYTIICNGFKTITGNLTVLDTNTSQTIYLEQQFYTIEISVLEGTVAVPGAWITLSEDRNSIYFDATDINGVAERLVENKTYSYTVDAEGYERAEGFVTVAGIDGQVMTLEVQMIARSYRVMVNLYHLELGIPIFGGASIQIGDQIFDASLPVNSLTFTKGTYYYTVTADHYLNKTGSFTVDPSSDALKYGTGLVHQVVLEPKIYDYTVSVLEGTVPISNANVLILRPYPAYNQSQVTDASGNTTFSLTAGNYQMQISASDYSDSATIDFTVTGTGSNAISLQAKTHRVTFFIKQYGYDLNGTTTTIELCPEATIQIASSSLITDENGFASTDLIHGVYHYIITFPGAISKTGSALVSNTDPDIIEIVLEKPLYNVDFTVQQEGQGPYIEINFDLPLLNTPYIRTMNGIPASVKLPNGTYTYRVTSEDNSASYIPINGELVVNGANLTVNHTLHHHKYQVVFEVYSFDAPLANASVTLYTTPSVTVETDAQGQAVFSVPKGNYSYFVGKQIPMHDNQQGNVVITDSDIFVSPINLTLCEGTVEITVLQNVQPYSPIEGATIQIGGLTQLTGADGIASFVLPIGYYTAIMTMKGYKSEVSPELYVNQWVTVSWGCYADMPPTAVEDVVEAKFNQALVVNVLLNDTCETGDTFTLKSFPVTSNRGGTLTLTDQITTDGEYTTTKFNSAIRYTPATDFSGIDTFTYTIEDAAGSTAIGQVRVFVQPRDILAPIYATDYPTVTTVLNDRLSVQVLANEAGTIYYMLCLADQTQPNKQQVVAGTLPNGSPAPHAGSSVLYANMPTTLVITNLVPDTFFSVYLVLEDAFENFTEISHLEARTLTPVKTLQVTEIGDATLTLSWQEYLDASSAVVMYKIPGNSDFEPAPCTLTPEEIGATSSVTVIGLTPGLTYTFKLAVTGGNYPGDSNIITALPGFAGGIGSNTDPYRIQTVSHFNNIRYTNGKFFVLEADLDFNISPYNSDYGWEPIGTANQPMSIYLDGNGHVISNLFINRELEANVGLFGSLTNSSIRNLGLDLININGGDQTGGLVGSMTNSSVQACFVNGIVNGGEETGVLVGKNNTNSGIYYSYALGSISSTGTIMGALVGRNNAYIYASYAAVSNLGNANMTLTSNSLTGRTDFCYYDFELIRAYKLDAGGGIEKTNAEMTQAITFANWDLYNTWAIQEGNYPFLRWLTPGADLTAPLFSVDYPQIEQIEYDNLTKLASLNLVTNVDEQATVYYVVIGQEDFAIPNALQILAGQNGNEQAMALSGNYLIDANRDDLHLITDLPTGQRISIYLLAKDSAGNVSRIKSIVLELDDITEPSLLETTEIVAGLDYMEIKAASNEQSWLSFVLLGTDDLEPNAEQILCGLDGQSIPTTLTGRYELDGSVWRINNLTANTSYKLYLVLEDIVGNLSQVFSYNVVTLNPIRNLTNTQIEDNQVTLTWSAPVDAEQVILKHKTTFGEYVFSTHDLTAEEILTASTATITDLERFTSYTFIVEVVGGQNAGLSNEISVITGFAGGRGTETDPFLIQTEHQLDNVRYNLAAHYSLTASLNLDTTPYNSGEGWIPIGNEGTPFTGSFQGAGYVISGLTINQPLNDQLGLFGKTEGALIRNLILNQVNITGRDQIGALAGKALTTSITQCAASNLELSGKNNIGGLVGLYSGMMMSSTVKASTLTGVAYIGGLVGYAQSAFLANNYVIASSLTGGRGVGGLVGLLDANSIIQKSYASASLSGEADTVYGLAGFGELVQNRITNSYYDAVNSQLSTLYLTGFARSTTQLKTKSTFNTWDFSSNWAIKEGMTTPYLRWEATGGEDDAPIFESGYPQASEVLDNSFVLVANLNKNTTLYYVVLPIINRAPNFSQIINGQDGAGEAALIQGSYSCVAYVESSIPIEGLDEGIIYKAYVCAVDLFYNISLVHSIELETPDTTEPYTYVDPYISEVTSEDLVLTLQTDEPVTLYYVLLLASQDAPNPSQIRSGLVSSAITIGNQTLVGNMDESIVISNLTPNTTYMLYLLMEDPYGNATLLPPILLETYPVKVAIESIILTNGSITVSYSSDVSEVTLDDFDILATFGGNQVELSELIFNANTHQFTFTPFLQTELNETLEVTVSANGNSNYLLGSIAATLSTGFTLDDLAVLYYYERGLELKQTAQELLNAGCSLSALATTLRSVLHISDAEVLIQLFEDLQITEPFTILTVLKEAGYSALDAVIYLKPLVQMQQILPLLNHFNFSGTDAVVAMKQELTSDLKTALSLSSKKYPVYYLGSYYDYYSINSLIVALKQAYSPTNADLFQVLLQSGSFTRDEIIATMAGVLQVPAMDLLVWLPTVYYQSKAATSLNSYYGFTLLESTKVIRDAGYLSIQPILHILKSAYSFNLSEITSIMKQAGFTSSENGKELRSFYGGNTQILAAALKNAGYSISEVTSYIQTVTSDAMSLVNLLSDCSFSLNQITFILRARLNLSEANAEALLLSSNRFSLEDILLQIQDIYGTELSILLRVAQEQIALSSSAMETALLLQNTYLVTDALVIASLLEQVGYTELQVTNTIWLIKQVASDLTTVLTSLYGKPINATELLNAGMPKLLVAQTLYDDYYPNYGSDIRTLLQHLHTSGFTAAEITQVIRSIFSTSFNDYAILDLLNGYGYSLQQSLICLKDVYGYNFSQAMRALFSYKQSYSSVAIVTTLYGLSSSEMIQQAKSGGYGYNDIVTFLKIAYGLGQLDCAKLLKSANVPGTNVLWSLAYAFSNGNIRIEEAAPLLKQAGFTASQASTALQTATSYSLESVLRYMRLAGYTTNETIAMLRTTEDMSDMEILVAFKNSQMSLTELGLVAKDYFGYTENQTVVEFAKLGFYLDEITKVLLNCYQSYEGDVAQILKDASYSATEIARVLKQVYGYLYVDVLQATGFTATQTAKALNEVYNVYIDRMAGQLYNASYNEEETALALKEYFQAPDYQTLELLTYAGYDLFSIGQAVITIYNTNATNLAKAYLYCKLQPDQVMQLIVDLYSTYEIELIINLFKYENFSIEQLDTALQIHYGSDVLSIVTALKNLGFRADVCGDLLLYNYGLGDSDAIAVLLGAGFTEEKTASYLRNNLNYTITDTLTTLLVAQADLVDTLFAIQAWYNPGFAGAILELQSQQVILAQVYEGVKQVYGVTDLQVTVVLLQLQTQAVNIFDALAESLGNSVMALKVLRNAGCGVADLGLILETSLNLNFEDAMEIMRLAGFTAVERVAILLENYNLSGLEAVSYLAEQLTDAKQTMVALTTVYGIASQESAKLMKQVGYTLTQISSALKNDPEFDNQSIIHCLLDLGFTPFETVTHFRSTYALTSTDLVLILANKNYSLVSIAELLANVYSSSAIQCGTALKTLRKVDISEIIRAMLAVQYPAEQVTAWLLKLNGFADTAKLLLQVGFTGPATMQAFSGAIPNFDKFSQSFAMYNGGYTLTDIVHGLQVVHQQTAEQILFDCKLIGSGIYITYSELARVVMAQYHLSIEDIYLLLQSHNTTNQADTLGKILKELGLTVAQTVALMKANYSIHTLVEQTLRVTYQQLFLTYRDEVTALLSAGYSVFDAIEAASREGFTSLSSKLTLLKEAGFQVPEMANYLVAKQVSIADAIATLQTLSCSLLEITQGLQIAYQLDSSLAITHLEASQLYTSEEIQVAIAEVYDVNALDSYIATLSNRPLADMIYYLVKVYDFTNVTELVEGFTRASYTPEEITKAMVRIFSIDQITQVILSTFNQANPAVLLKSSGYIVEQVIAELFFLNKTANQSIVWLTEAGYHIGEGVHSMVKALRSQYNLSSNDIAILLKGNTYTAAEIWSVLNRTSQLTAVTGLKVAEFTLNEIVLLTGFGSYACTDLKTAGYSILEIGQAFLDVFKTPYQHLFIYHLKNIGATVTELLTIFQANPSYLSLSNHADLIKALSNHGGYTPSEIAFGLKNQMSLLESEVTQGFKSAYFTVSQVAIALNATYTEVTNLQLFQDLLFAGYLENEIVLAMKVNLLKTAEQTKQYLMDSDAYTLAQAALLMLKSQFTLADIRNCWPEILANSSALTALNLKLQGSSAADALKLMDLLFGESRDARMIEMKSAGFSANALILAFKNQYNLVSEYQQGLLMGYVLKAGYELPEILTILLAVYNLNQDVSWKIFSLLNPYLNQYEASSLKTIVKVIKDDLIARRQEATEDRITGMLDGSNLDYNENELFKVYLEAGMKPNEILDLARSYAFQIFEIASFFKSLGFSLSESYDFLYRAMYAHFSTGNSKADLLQICARESRFGAGYSIAEIIEVFSAHNMANDWSFVSAMKTTGYGDWPYYDPSIGEYNYQGLDNFAYLKDIMSAEYLARSMKYAGYYDVNVAYVLKTHYGTTLEQATMIFKRVDFSVEEAAQMMREVYEVADIEILASAMIQGGYDRSRILNYYFIENPNTILPLMSAGFTIVDMARQFNKTHSRDQVLLRLMDMGFSLNDALFGVRNGLYASTNISQVAINLMGATDLLVYYGYCTSQERLTAIENLTGVNGMETWVYLYNGQYVDMVRAMKQDFNLTPDEIEVYFKAAQPHLLTRLSAYSEVYRDPAFLIKVCLSSGETNWDTILNYLEFSLHYYWQQILPAIRANCPDESFGQAAVKIGQYLRTRNYYFDDFYYYTIVQMHDPSIFPLMKQAGLTARQAKSLLEWTYGYDHTNKVTRLNWLCQNGYSATEIIQVEMNYAGDGPFCYETLVDYGYDEGVVAAGIHAWYVNYYHNHEEKILMDTLRGTKYNYTNEQYVDIYFRAGLPANKTFMAIYHEICYIDRNFDYDFRVVAALIKDRYSMSVNNIGEMFRYLSRYDYFYFTMTYEEQYEIIRSLINLDDYRADNKISGVLTEVMSFLDDYSSAPDELMKTAMTLQAMRNVGYDQDVLDDLLKYSTPGWGSAMCILIIWGLSFSDIVNTIIDLYGQWAATKMLLGFVPIFGPVWKAGNKILMIINMIS